MKYFSYALISIAFYGLIGATIYFTNSLIPLLGLFFTPSSITEFSNSNDTEDIE
jgi:hypothetical protein